MNDRLTQRPSRSGQAMVEFAIISFLLTAMLAGFLGLIVMGLGSFQNNIAAESAGRLLDRHPRLSADAFQARFKDPNINPYTATASNVIELLTYDDSNFNALFGERMYHDRRLVLSPTEWANSANLPDLIQRLLPSYIYDPDVTPDSEPNKKGAYRYPGAVVKRTVGSEIYQTVLIPLLSIDGVEPCHDSDCQCESKYWVAPLRICKILDCDCDATPPVASNPIGSEPTFLMSLVYPSQPASMLYIEIRRDEQGNIDPDDDGIYQTPVTANDDEVADKYATELATLPDDYSFDLTLSPNSTVGASPSRGRYGLGESNAFLKKVRPYRRVFETRSAFRLSFGATTAKYKANGMPIDLVDANDDEHTMDVPQAPFLAFEDQDDQFLNFRQQVIDREPAEISLVIPTDPSVVTFNDFLYRALRVPTSSDGIWRISVAAEFQPDAGTWEAGHRLELRLYVNGKFDQVFAFEEISLAQAAIAGHGIRLLGNSVIDAQAGDTIQVRVYSAHPNPAMATYETQLTGVPERNWITYELLNAR